MLSARLSKRPTTTKFETAEQLYEDFVAALGELELGLSAGRCRIHMQTFVANGGPKATQQRLSMQGETCYELGRN